MAGLKFPGGASVAVVTSWDGGRKTDRITLEMLDKYGYKGTFFVRPQEIGTEGFLSLETLKQIASTGHEVGLLSPDSPEALTPEAFQKQISEARTQLETMAGAPVVGFSYPEGLTQEPAWMAEAVLAAGFTYARSKEAVDLITVGDLTANGFKHVPVTSHFLEEFMEFQTKWDAAETAEEVFHLWGDTNGMGETPDDWVNVECNLGFIGGITHVWYGTIGEFVTYIRQHTA